MDKDLKLLVRLHEIFEYQLFLFSSDVTCSASRLGYEHEFNEISNILDLLCRLINKTEKESEVE